MSLCEIVPVAQLQASNSALAAAGFGERNFSVACFTGAAATHAALHAWDSPAFATAVKALPGVVFDESAGDPVTRTAARITAQSAKWGNAAPDLPSTGNVTAGSLYRFEDSLWSVIQTYSRTTYPAHPSTYPALIRRVRQPGIREQWTQPIDQYDAYRLVNAFTGRADECTHNGKSWRTTVDTNVWAPGTAGVWTEIDADGTSAPASSPEPAPEPSPAPAAYPAWAQPAGAHDAYKTGDIVTFNDQVWRSKINANVYSPAAYPAGWELVT
ncbi:MAG: hypothetical protein IT480_10705 [Gammaproteobacteria bacterium]|nr:hypothetical protein [Gammaproteobacteria bacterium]